MAQDELEGIIKRMHGAVEKGGSISRVKTFHDSDGKIIGYGPQERYTRQPRDYNKHPITDGEKAHQALWTAACKQAKAELDDPTKLASWQARFNEQLQHATADTPAKLVNGQRVKYKDFKAFVRTVIYYSLKG